METTPNMIERLKMVKAMDFIIRQINDEGILERWLTVGIADGDIEYGDLETSADDLENLGYYTEDTNFGTLMFDFLRCMAAAKKNGGLYCDGVVSKDGNGNPVGEEG